MILITHEETVDGGRVVSAESVERRPITFFSPLSGRALKETLFSALSFSIFFFLFSAFLTNKMIGDAATLKTFHLENGRSK